MQEFIEKKLITAKNFRIILLVLLIITVGAFASFSVFEETDISFVLVSVSILALWISGAFYWGMFIPFTSNVKWLRNKGMLDIANDINPEKPTQAHPKMYYGRKALFSDKAGVIIPYAEIAWVYVHELKNKYNLTVEKSVIIHTREGKKFTLTADVNVFQRALQNYIIVCSPNIVIGYGAEQKARYMQLNPVAAEAEKKNRIIKGLALAAVGVAFLLALIFSR